MRSPWTQQRICPETRSDSESESDEDDFLFGDGNDEEVENIEEEEEPMNFSPGAENNEDSTNTTEDLFGDEIS